MLGVAGRGEDFVDYFLDGGFGEGEVVGACVAFSALFVGCDSAHFCGCGWEEKDLPPNSRSDMVGSGVFVLPR